MKRTTIMADERILEQLRQIARREGSISLGEAIREALEWRASRRPGKLAFIGSAESKGGPHDTARRSGELTAQPRPWRSS